MMIKTANFLIFNSKNDIIATYVFMLNFVSMFCDIIHFRLFMLARELGGAWKFLLRPFAVAPKAVFSGILVVVTIFPCLMTIA